MPWKEVTIMEELLRFAGLAASGRFTLKELCSDFGISRKTGYKHLERDQAEGIRGLRERSRRPLHGPNKIEEQGEKLVIAERKVHPRWDFLKGLVR